jgi:serine/threonine-protein kinase
MLAGKTAFQGDSVSDILATVLKLDPDWSALPATTPASIKKLIRRCLTKDRKQRLQAIGEARIVLENPAVDDPAPTAAPSQRLRYAGWVAAALLAAALPVAWTLKPAPPTIRNVVRFTETVPLVNVAGGLAMSSDGSRLAFVGGGQEQIYVRTLDQLEARPLPGTEGASHLSFSPDGQWISFVTGERQRNSVGRLKKVAVTGGPVQTLGEAIALVGPPVQKWGEDGNILFSSQGLLKRVSANGGQPETLAQPDTTKGETYYADARLLPDHRTILVSVYAGPGTLQHRLVAINMQTGQRKTVLENIGIASYAPSAPGSNVGHLVYFAPNSNSLMAVPFDAGRVEAKGAAVPMIEGIQSVVGPFGAYAFSETGSLIYLPGGAASANEKSLVWVDRQGGEQPTAAPLRQYNLPRVSPDSERVAVEVQDPSNQTVDVWVYDLVRGSATRITHENRNLLPVWMPDGKRLLFASGVAPSYALTSAPADGSSSPSVISNSTEGCLPDSVSPDGKFVIGRGRGEKPGGGNSTCVWSLADGTPADSKMRYLQNAPFNKLGMQFSPDGRFIAYGSNESGRNEIYVEPAPGAPAGVSGKHTISAGGGNAPRWAGTGRELFYLSGNKMMVVDIQTSPAFTLGKPRMLFEGPYSNGYDVAPDGKRFLMVRSNAPPVAAATPQLHVVLNWFQELQRRAPASK